MEAWWKFLLNNCNQWSFVFMTMAIELILCTVIITPLPISWRTRLLEKISWFWNSHPRFRIATNTWMSIITVLFLDALRQMYMVHVASVIAGPGTDPLEALANVGNQKDVEMTLYAAQRNAYLCGFTVFLFTMLYRFQSMADKITELELRISSYQTVPTTKTVSTPSGDTVKVVDQPAVKLHEVDYQNRPRKEVEDVIFTDTFGNVKERTTITPTSTIRSRPISS